VDEGGALGEFGRKKSGGSGGVGGGERAHSTTITFVCSHAFSAQLRDDNELPQYRDYENAMKYFSKAAANGHTPALHKLGTLYKRGLGVTRSCNR